MRFFATRQQAYRYGKRMSRPHGVAFLVAQVESGRWIGYWFAMPQVQS